MKITYTILTYNIVLVEQTTFHESWEALYNTLHVILDCILYTNLRRPMQEFNK